MPPHGWRARQSSTSPGGPPGDGQAADITGGGSSARNLAGACSRAAPEGLPLERDAIQWAIFALYDLANSLSNLDCDA